MTRDDKLLVLFDFYMYREFSEYGLNVSANCPFRQSWYDGIWIFSCINLCGSFFGTGFDCPCSVFGPVNSIKKLETLLIDEGMIED